MVDDAARLIDFLQSAFQAEELLRVPRPGGGIMHAEVRIGDSRLELGGATEEHRPMTAALHLYVPDADDAYRRAIAAGASSLHEPVDQEYGDREAAVEDPSGNHWYVATHKLAPGRYAPAGLRDVTPFFHPHGAGKLIDFLKQAFLADESEVYSKPDGTILHAKIKVGDSVLEVSEAHGRWGPMPCTIHLYVPDTDSTYQRALAAGATSVREPGEPGYGDRTAIVLDSFGNYWCIATHLGRQTN